jgi:polyvinyl alcohol dehydrogenase (cytochrome)
MNAIDRRPVGTALLLAFTLCAAHPHWALAQQSGSSSHDGSCSTVPEFKEPLSAPHWNGWGADVAQHRFQPASMAQVAAGDVPRLKLKWAFGFPGVTRMTAQPTVMSGRLFIGSQTGVVRALDTKSGCMYWEYDAKAPVRSAITIGQNSDGWSAYFGDRNAIVHAVDALSGKPRWAARIDDHPAAMITGAPTLVEGKLFVPVSSFEEVSGASSQYGCCSFRGSIVALDAATGKPVWKSYTIAQEPTLRATNTAGIQLRGPSGAAVWSSTTYDARSGVIYATTGDNYSDPPSDTSDAILAFNATSGQLAWSHQVLSGDAYTIACAISPPGPNCPAANGPDLDFGSSAILADLSNGKRALIGGQKSGVVTAVDPDHAGQVLWQKQVGHGGKLGGVQWGPAADGDRIYVAISDLQLSVVSLGAPGAQPSPFNPAIGLLLNSHAGGGLHALKLETGEEVWHTPHPGCNDVPGCSPAQSAAVTAIPGIVFSGGLDGHLRAYAAEDGHIVWDVDTKGEYHTVNGVAAHGGSIDGAGAVIVDGMLYQNSGSGLWGGTPGNVLLAYSVDGR